MKVVLALIFGITSILSPFIVLFYAYNTQHYFTGGFYDVYTMLLIVLGIFLPVMFMFLMLVVLEDL